MKRVNLLYVLLFCVSILSCEREVRTYSDALEAENIVIDRFMDKQGFKVLKEYPKEGVFGDKEFVLLDNGVYLHVIDSGNGNRPVHGTDILSLAQGHIWSKDTTTQFNGFQLNDKGTKWPLKFKYGSVDTPYEDNYLLGEGFASAMNFVGDSSSVSMIVPFRVGSLHQQSTYLPVYYEKVNFTFVK